MILISHRGNTIGPKPEKENTYNYIIDTLHKGYDIEIDIWYFNNKIMLGHDFPINEISNEYQFFTEWNKRLWLHCKNIEVIYYIENKYTNLNYFWHETDTITLTSQKYMWAYPGKQPIKNSIAVMPELNNDDVSQCLGICSDYIEKYK